MTRQPDNAAQSQRYLEEIARTIGVPVSSFYVREAGSTLSDLPTLTRLYAAITNAEGRQRVMNVARREAERCQASQSIPKPE